MGKGSYITKGPAVIPGLTLWLDASDTSTIDASSVSEWKDKSGNNNHATQLTGSNQPTSGTHTINGINGIYFDGVNHYISANAIATLLTGSDVPFSMFVVFEPTDETPGSSEVLIGIGSSTSNTPLIDLNQVTDGTTSLLRRDNTASSSVITQTAVSGPKIHVQAFSGTTVSVWVNGVLENNEEAMDVGTLSLDRFTIGALLRASVSNQYNGVIGQVLIYNRRLSDEEITFLTMESSNKWGISS